MLGREVADHADPESEPGVGGGVEDVVLRLEADGLLRILPKKGAYIAPITEIEVDAIMQARGLVEEWFVKGRG